MMEFIDFSLVHADDSYVDGLAAPGPHREPPDELTADLLAWRHAVDAEPIHELGEPWFDIAVVWAALARRDRRGECA